METQRNQEDEHDENDKNDKEDNFEDDNFEIAKSRGSSRDSKRRRTSSSRPALPAPQQQTSPTSVQGLQGK